MNLAEYEQLTDKIKQLQLQLEQLAGEIVSQNHTDKAGSEHSDVWEYQTVCPETQTTVLSNRLYLCRIITIEGKVADFDSSEICDQMRLDYTYGPKRKSHGEIGKEDYRKTQFKQTIKQYEQTIEPLKKRFKDLGWI